MRIEHLAIWVKDLELCKQFYTTYFEAAASDKYHNPNKGFTSYFLSFEDGARLELMHRSDIDQRHKKDLLGMTHLAISVGSEQKVNQLTERIRQDGHQIAGEPRVTGDGYYESVVLDPEGNQIEITV